MDTTALNKIIDGCSALLTKNGFAATDVAGEFTKDSTKFAVKYLEDSKMMVLEYTETADMEGSETVIANWLYEGIESDIPVIVEDFCDQIGVKLGIVKPAASLTANNIAMPTKKAKGDEYTIDSLTQKILAVFPAFKEVYKENVAKYNTFLYVDFYKSTLVPKLREICDDYSANKKTIDKSFKLLAEAFYNCDKETSELVCGLIVAGTFFDKKDKLDACLSKLEEFPLFTAACKAVVEEAAANKKFKQIFA
ncbi:MAG: hypothetical protein IKV36_02140 [Clostridia bacterium]|nr:hypothetical protein [Clostridia bacterium]